MRNCLLMLVILSCAVNAAKAQKIRFTDTSNKWTMIAFTSDPSAGPASARYTRDTVIRGMLYHRLTTNGSVMRDTLAVREDTMNGKIYFRFVTPNYFGRIPTDTVEHVLFDYTLSAGDTLTVNYATRTEIHVVKRLDSVQLGMDFYKHWAIQASTGWYEFIEGVGTNQSPANIFYPFGLIPERYQLRCFSSNGIRPSCKPAVYTPSGTPGPMDPWKPILLDSFDNNISCTLQAPASVNHFSEGSVIAIAPNPGGSDITLKAPADIHSGTIQITDISGRSISQIAIKEHETNIGQYLSTPGVYFYSLQDAATGQRYTGRFIFR